MTVKDLAKRLGIGQSAAFKLMQSPGFPSIKVGFKGLSCHASIPGALRARLCSESQRLVVAGLDPLT